MLFLTNMLCYQYANDFRLLFLLFAPSCSYWHILQHLSFILGPSLLFHWASWAPWAPLGPFCFLRPLQFLLTRWTFRGIFNFLGPIQHPRSPSAFISAPLVAFSAPLSLFSFLGPLRLPWNSSAPLRLFSPWSPSDFLGVFTSLRSLQHSCNILGPL